MATLYKIGPGGYWTGDTQIADAARSVPSGWTARPMQDLPEGCYARLTLAGWVITATPPPEVAPTLVVMRAADAMDLACTRRQGRLALLQLDMLDAAEAAIDSIEDAVQRRMAQIEYEADTWERSNQFLQQLWAGLGGTPQQLDDAFRLAVML